MSSPIITYHDAPSTSDTVALLKRAAVMIRTDSYGNQGIADKLEQLADEAEAVLPALLEAEAGGTPSEVIHARRLIAGWLHLHGWGHDPIT